MPARSDQSRTAGRIAALGLGWGWIVAGLWLVRYPPSADALITEWRGIRAGLTGWSAGGMLGQELVSLRAVAAFLLFTAASRAAGCLGLAWAAPRSSRRAGWIPALPAGWGLAGLTGFGCAACGLFRLPVVAILVAAGALAGIRGLLTVSRAAGREIGEAFHSAGRGGRVCAGLVIILAGVELLAALAPETGEDSLIHHLPVAARILALGSLVPMPGNALFHVSALSEILRAASMVLGGEPAARLLSPLAAVLTVIWLVTGVRARAGASWAWAAAGLFLSAQPVMGLGMGCKPDILLAPCGLAVFIWLGRESRWRSTGRAMVAGWLLGTAAGIKYLSGALAGAMVAVAMAGGSPLGVGAAMVAGIAGPVMPWLFKSWLLTGNPVYPAGFVRFGGLDLTAASSDAMLHYMKTVTHRVGYATVQERLAAPWSLSLLDGAPPAWLALLPLALLWPRARSWRWPAAVAAFLALWAAGPVQYRYLTPVLGVLAWLSAESLAAAPRAGGTLCAASLIVLQTLQVFSAPDPDGSLAAGLGAEDRTHFFGRRLPAYAEALGILGRTAPRRRILLIGTDAAYPPVGRLLVASRMQPPQTYALLRASRNAPELWRRMRQLGVTHVLYNPTSAVYNREFQSAFAWSGPNLMVWEALWRKHAREIWRSPRMSERHGWFILYALTAQPPAAPSFGYLPGIEGVFSCVEVNSRIYGSLETFKEFQLLDPLLGRYGLFRHFEARMCPELGARRILAACRSAEATGYRDVSLFEDEIRLGGLLNDRAAIASATRRRAVEFVPQ